MRSSILAVMFGAFAVSAVSISACSSSDKSVSGNGATGGTLIVAQAVVGGIGFPPLVDDNGGKFVQDLVFDRLAEISDNLSTVGDKSFTPRLAKSWTWAPDSLSIAFSLDPRARWHDGKPVTAADVRYTFKVFTDSVIGSSTAPTLQNLDSVTVRDSLTAVVWFKKHTPGQFYDVVYQLPIVPEHVYGSIASKDLRTSDAVRNPIGSGRFRFRSWQPGARLELVADTLNYRGRPSLDRVLVVNADLPAAAAQVLSGQADFVEAFPIDQAAKLDSNAFARALVLPQLGYVFVGMNSYAPKSKSAPHPIFSDLRVRRALSMAIDRQALLHNVFGDRGRLGHGPFPSVAVYADTTLRLPPFDTTAARALLDSAGWRTDAGSVRAKNGHPLRFSLLVPTSSALRMRYAVLLQEAFRRVGAQVELDQIDFPTFRQRQFAGDFDAVMGGFNTDPSISGSKQNWSTSGIGADGQNVLKYSNHVVDALLDSAAGAFDQSKMKSYGARAFQQVINDVPAIWLYDVVTVDAVSRRFNTAPFRADAWWMNLSDWSVPADKRIDRDRVGLTPAKP